jgi:hypothetical protein
MNLDASSNVIKGPAPHIVTGYNIGCEAARIPASLKDGNFCGLRVEPTPYVSHSARVRVLSETEKMPACMAGCSDTRSLHRSPQDGRRGNSREKAQKTQKVLWLCAFFAFSRLFPLSARLAKRRSAPGPNRGLTPANQGQDGFSLARTCSRIIALVCAGVWWELLMTTAPSATINGAEARWLSR